MRTKTILGVILCFGVAFALLSGSGVATSVFGQSADNAETTETLGDVADESSVDSSENESGLSADVTGDNEPTVTGIALAGGQFAVRLVGAVALLPVTLVRLGFPAFFAVPVGAVAQTLAFIGLIQFITGREYL